MRVRVKSYGKGHLELDARRARVRVTARVRFGVGIRVSYLELDARRVDRSEDDAARGHH